MITPIPAHNTLQVVYFTATVPIILIITVTIKGATLEGASVGIYYYLKPNMTQLENPEVK